MNELKFPKDFFWGAATSAHQIEGGLTNDWSEWEKSEKRLKQFVLDNKNPIDFISGSAANSYADTNADIVCMKELNLNAYRFSVDWSRIEPCEGEFNTEALDYYRNLIKKLRGGGIEPMITLWHWPIPVWMRDKGGWEHHDIVRYFDRFVEKTVQYLHEEVNFWVTLNEPMVYSSMSYLRGEWPPQKKSFFAYYRVISHLYQAHNKAYTTIKALDSESQVGIAKHNIYFEAHENKLRNRIVKFFSVWWWNRRFLNKIKDTVDFIGVNYYFHTSVNHTSRKKHEYEKKSDLGWGLHPEGIYFVLKELEKYKKPIYITENGLADKGDQHRSWYIREVLKNVHRAIEGGIPIRGYFHWSLIDNFEWAYGFHPRFGLYEVDFQTYERKARSSAEYYADICKNNRVV